MREYMDSWLATARPRLAPRTAENYGVVVRLHVVPYLGDLPLGDLTPAVIRHWHATLLEIPVGPTTVAKAYRVLRAAMNTAVEDELIVRNPCVLKGAGVEKSVERPVASIDQVFALADAVEHRFRALVLLAAFACLRQSELFALTRRSLDLEAGVLRVTAAAHDLRNGQRVVRQPKTAAGVRTIAIPTAIRDDLQAHLDLYVDASPDSLIFTGEKGAPLRRNHWATKWRHAVRRAGMDGFRFHDLRHTGNTLAAATGASTRELMARMGHSSPQAALRYQHATREREHAIADALSTVIEQRREPSNDRC